MNTDARKEQYEAWKEATIAWAVCASVHREWGRYYDPVFKTRQADYVRHEEAARKKMLEFAE